MLERAPMSLTASASHDQADNLLLPTTNQLGASGSIPVVNGSNAPKRAKIEWSDSNSLAGQGDGQANSAGSKRSNGHNSANSGNRNATPSRVIHLRNIPTDASEAEIIQLGIAFGRITNILLLKGKNQAFLEMEDESSAATMVSYLANCPQSLRDRLIYAQFSNHKQLKTDNSSSNSSISTQAALQAANTLVSGSPRNRMTDLTSPRPLTSMPNQQNTVLHVTVDNMIYPVTLDVLCQIFSRIGKVQKIVTFTKSNSYQALVQMADVVQAQAARVSLDGRNIYNGCCTLKIEFSKLTALNVKYNNDKSRDYTNPDLGAGPLYGDEDNGGLVNQLQALQGAAAAPNRLMNSGASDGNAPGRLNSLQTAQQQQLLNAAASGTGHLTALNAALSGAATVGLQHQHNNAAAVTALQSAVAAAVAAGQGGVMTSLNSMASSMSQNAVGSVLLVTSLNERYVGCDQLFTLFGVYGNVMRIKIMHSKRHTALVQMEDIQQALLAMAHLDRIRLFGSSIKVVMSKHNQVSLPRTLGGVVDPEADMLNKDYAGSQLNRFKKPGSKNHGNIYPPSMTLHLSNIPECITEQQLIESFTNCDKGHDLNDEDGQAGNVVGTEDSRNNYVPRDLTVIGFKFFPQSNQNSASGTQSDRRMALIKMDSLEEAVIALIRMHDYPLTEKSHLRVSFTKSTL